MKLKINCNWHKFVDLGLPSGLLWATCNIGAKEPWENGLYFSWGNVDGNKNGFGYDFSESEYAATPGAALISSIVFNAKCDAARANIGGSWRTPTKDEIQELQYYCTKDWTTQNGVAGMMFVSRVNSNSVFFPAAGYYVGTSLSYEGTYGGFWSSSLRSQTYAFGLFFGMSYVHLQAYSCRFIGYPVRAVLDHPKDSLLIKTIKR